MKHPALSELRDLTNVPDDGLRSQLLEEWIASWLHFAEFEQAVLSTKYLTAEYNDAIKFKLAQCISEELAEECAEFKTQDKKIAATVCAIRRRAK